MLAAWAFPLLRGLCLFSLVVTSTSIALASPSSADIDGVTCESSYGSRFDGYIIEKPDSQGQTYEGVKAFIDVRRGDICDTPPGIGEENNFIYVFVMLTDGGNPAPNPRRYIQAGYLRWDNGCTHWTSEYLNSNNANGFVRTVDLDDGCRSLSGNDGFSVRFVESGKSQMVAIHNGDTTVLDHTPFDIFADWTMPFHTQYTAETKYIQSNVPGTSQDQTYFQQIQQQKFDDSWTNSLPTDILDACPWPKRHQKSIFDSAQDLFIVETTTATGSFC